MSRSTGWRWLGVVVVAVAAAAVVFYLLRSSPAPAEPTLPPADSPAATAPAAAPEEEVRVYFSRGDTSASVARPAAGGATGPEAALRALLAGPTSAERAAGISSWFSVETAGLLNSFSIAADSVAHVDFGDLTTAIPSASSSAGSEMLLRELNSTLFRYPEIKAIEYTINGSCDLFWNWLQYGCEQVTRPQPGR